MRGVSRQTVIWFALPFALLLALGVWIHKDYAVGIDEPTETGMLYDHWRVVTNRYMAGNFDKPYENIAANTLHYGTLFNLIAFGFQKLVTPDAFSLRAYEIKHLLTFLFSTLSYLAIAFALWKVTRSRWAMVAAIAALALQPYYFGLSMFYPKDSPFAGMYSVTSVALALYVAWLIRVRVALAAKEYAVRQRFLGYTLLLGLLLGCLSSVRIGGLVVVVYGAPLAAALLYVNGWRGRALAKLLGDVLAIAGCACLLVIWVLHPPAWVNPFLWLYDSFVYFAYHPNTFHILTAGKWIDPLDTPRSYLLLWFYAQTPLLWIPAALAGLGMVMRDWRAASPQARALFLFLLAQMLFLPLLAIVLRSNLSAGFREFIFVQPPFAFLIAYGFIRLCCVFAKYRAAIIGVFAGYALVVADDMRRIHPFQHEYLNEVEISRAYGYWMSDLNTNLSLETARWLNANAVDNSRVLTSYGADIKFYLNPALQWVAEDGAALELRHLYAASTVGRWPWLSFRAECPLVYSIERTLHFGTLQLGQIRKCR